MWRIRIDHHLSAAAHMARDARAAARAQAGVRFFTWHPPGISLGWKQPTPVWLEAKRWRQAGLSLVERPTGGGMAFHGSDVSLALVIPREGALPLETIMQAACRTTVALCRVLGAQANAQREAPVEGRITYCLTQSSPYAVYVGGRKVAGFALRRYPASWLIQGSLLVRPLDPLFAAALPEEVRSSLRERACALSEAGGRPLSKEAVIEWWAGGWASWWEDAVLDAFVTA